MGNYDAEVRIGTKVDISQMQKLQYQIDNATNNVDRLTKHLEKLEITKTPTEEYVRLSAKIKETEELLERLIAKQKYFTDYGKENRPAFSQVKKQIVEAESGLAAMRAEMQELVNSGRNFRLNDEEIKKTKEELVKAESELKRLLMKQEELSSKSIKVSDGFRKVSDGLKRIGSIGAKAFSGVNHHVRKSNGLLGTFTSKLKGMALSLLIFNWISKGFNAMVSGMKDGFKNLVQYSDEYNRSISSLQSANAQLKNSFAAAFAPIVQMIIPYLVQLIGYVTTAMNTLAQFMAILSGASTWTKATAVQKNYAASLKGTASAAKKAAGALASFDEIEVLNKKDNSGGVFDAGKMFEKVPVGKLSGFWKKLLDALKNGKWYELGKYLGEQLKNALDNIPWNEIKEKARRVAKNLADLINGFIEVEGLGYSIGRTLAEAFNTGFEFLNSFVHEFHFDSLGKFIAEELNGLFENIDWTLIKDTFVTGAKGIADLINSFDKYFHWDNISDAISNGLNTLSATFITFFETVDWADIGKNIGKQLIEAIKKTDWESVGRAIGDVIHSAIIFLAGILSELDWSVISEAIKNLIKGFFQAFDNESLPDEIKNIADAITNFAKVMGKLILIKGIADFTSTLGGLFGLFTGGTVASEISGTAIAINKLTAAIGAAEVANTLLSHGIYGVAKAYGKNVEQIDALEERYAGGLGKTTVNAITDAVGGFRVQLEGLPFALSGAQWAFDALDKMMGEIAEGTIYTDEQLRLAQETWKLSAEDVEMLRQSMLDANESTFSWAKAFPELNDASAQTLSNISDGLQKMRDGTVQNEVDLANLAKQCGYTDEAFSFLANCVTDNAMAMSKSMTDFSYSVEDCIKVFPELENASSQTLANVAEGMELIDTGVVQNEVDLAELVEQSGYTNEAFTLLAEYLTGTVSPTLADTSESIEDNSFALQNEQEELANANTAFEGHQQALDNTNTKLKSTQTEMTNTKNKSKDMTQGIKTYNDDLKKTTDTVWTKIGNIMKDAIANAWEYISEIFSKIRAGIEDIISGISSIMHIGSGSSGGSSSGGAAASFQSYASEIPCLATGAVIRGGNPFMAVLGDQRFGQTNIEAPLSTIEDAMRNVMADNSYSGGDVAINLNYDGETFARLFLPDFFAEAHRQGYDFDFEPE